MKYINSNSGEIRDIDPLFLAKISPIKSSQWTPYIEPETQPQVPLTIEQYKLRLWLIEKGLLPLVEGMIANEANWPSAQAHAEAVTRWDCVQNVQRDSVMVNTLGAALGLDQDQIDAAFIEASKLT